MRKKLIELLKYKRHLETSELADWLIANGFAGVVRCKDCVYSFGSAEADLMFCSAPIDTAVRIKPNHFCSKGEREVQE